MEAPEWPRPLWVAETGPGGEFAFRVSRNEMTLLRFLGGGLRDLVVPLPPGVDRVRLDVVLGPEPWPIDAERVSVVSALNGFGLCGGRLMEEQSDGSFFVAITDAPTGRFPYLICEERTRRLYPGTAADEWELDGKGRPRAVLLPREGPMTVRFDPRLLQGEGSESCLRVLEGPASIERFVDLYEGMRDERLRVARGYDRVEQKHETAEEFLAALERDAEEKAAVVAGEPDPAVRSFAAVTSLAAWDNQPNAKLLARFAIDEVGPASPYWGLFPRILLGLPARTGASIDEIGRFIERVVRESPDRRVRAEALLALLQFAREGDPDLYARTRRELLRELPESAAAEQVRESWPASLPLGRGRPFPRVRIPALEKGRAAIDLGGFRGRWVLLDFWAVWCGPCVEEIPVLARIEKRFRDRLSVVSVSLDRKREHVEAFRANGAMPWLHGFLEKGFEDPLAKRLAIRAVPTYFLIGPDGTLRATSFDLRPGGIEASLDRYLRMPPVAVSKPVRSGASPPTHRR